MVIGLAGTLILAATFVVTQPARSALGSPLGKLRALSCTVRKSSLRRGFKNFKWQRHVRAFARSSTEEMQKRSEPMGQEETERYSIFGLSEAKYPTGWEAPEAKIEYKDSLIDRHFLGIFMARMASATKTSLPDGDVNYENFLRLCFESIRGKNAEEQTKQSLAVLNSFLPPGGDAVFQKLFPKRKSSYELNAQITKTAFSWLVGPISLSTTSENDEGVPMKSKAVIKKCRWLQESACTGMCVNLCKRPTQDFFTNTFGLPLTIKPNFDDKSCEFYFGLTPPAMQDDPAYQYPCHVRCESGKNDDNEPCRKLPKFN
mmetsp:Transcript_2032/g.4640  ORF Transcript_2032/g.4640 Transcript_2032/m.4640 type:complete len:316 (-) Transcript_2032:21-968(-)